MTTYNVVPEFMAEALASLRRQSYHDWHLYICDASEDDTALDLLYGYLPQHKWTYITQRGTGVANAVNTAVKAGNNPYVCFLDADDYWSNDHLTFGLAAVNQNAPIGFTFSQVIQSIKSKKGGYITTQPKEGLNYPMWETTKAEDWWVRIAAKPCLPGSWILRRDVALQHQFDESWDHASDTDALISILKRHSPLVIPRVTFTYRVHGAQTNQRGDTTLNNTKVGKPFTEDEIEYIASILNSEDDYHKKLVAACNLREQFAWTLERTK